jgi:hypothetical protein
MGIDADGHERDDRVAARRMAVQRTAGPAYELAGRRPGALLYRPADAEDLAAFLRYWILTSRCLWLGLGSNLLVDDRGFPGP